MFLIKARQYLLWFLVNFFICLLPIMLYVLLKRSTSQMFSSFISFNYTLLIVSFYLCYYYFKKLEDEEMLPDYILFPTLGVILIIYGLFWVYNLSTGAFNYIESNIYWFSLIVFGLSLFFSLILNKPLIRENIDREIQKRRNKKQRKTGKHAQDIRDQLEKEGI